MQVCAKCKSNKLMKNIGLVDHYGDFGNQVKAAEVEVFKNPDAWFFQGRTTGSLFSVICGDCGYVETYVENPRELYEVYLKSLKAMNKSRE